MSRPPLDGVVVADFSRVLAGPLATMTLADLGARVIKVERAGSGDDTRRWTPPASPRGGTYFDSVNRNKESIELDLSDDGDRSVAASLVDRADVVVENFRSGTMERLGLGYDEVRSRNLRVVYASITGFGPAEGAALPGYDFVVQALGGLMSVTGDADGEGMKAGVALVDVLTGKDVAIGVLAALASRAATGEGARIEVNLLSSLQGALANQAQAWLGAGSLPGRLGNIHPSIAPYQTLRCSDGAIAVACGNDGQFARLAATIGMPELASDERFATNPVRVANRAALEVILESTLADQPASHWEQLFTAAGVPAGHVATIAEGIDLAESLGLSPTIELRDSDGVPAGRQIRHPISWTPLFRARADAPPHLGQDSTRIRRWLDERPTPIEKGSS
ncbi:CoA transferase [Glaciihabitans sp. UYNi722]|uniref:CaiB/BaiF CoA transferase family protein n=1 Tax=Glaciihabitans sp. UYNi722 TaxID=3156344 RepID=UPI003391EE06